MKYQLMKTMAASMFCSLAFSLSSGAQTDTTKSPLKIKGYLETYYVYDFANPATHDRPAFFYSYNRHNEVNLNIGLIQAEYETNKVRGKLALMMGTYANANLASEPGVLKNIYESNVGVKISSKKNLWVDAGIFASHIGFESAIGRDCRNMTRSILADNSPYYESGARLSYTSDSGHWYLAAMVLNGWQRITRVDGNNTPAFGHQITYKPNDKISLNSSSFIGSDKADSVRQMRYFHNFYGTFQVTKKLDLIAGFDIGAEQKAKGSSKYNVWYAPVFIARYAFTEKFALAGRAEYYSDVHGVIINSGTTNGFQTFGYSANLDVNITPQVLWRIEARTLNSRGDYIFMDKNQNGSQKNTFVGTSLSLSF